MGRTTNGLLLSSVLAGAGLSSSISLAQPQAATSSPASLDKMRLSVAVVPAPFGKFEFSLNGMGASTEAALAYGLRAAFDYRINEYVFVGFGPQVLFNVIEKEAPEGAKASKQLDLSARLGVQAPFADKVHLYVFLSPGYTILTSPNDDNVKGASLGIAVGVLFSIPGTNFFLNGDLGYHMTFLYPGNPAVDLETKYLLIALGGGFTF